MNEIIKADWLAEDIREIWITNRLIARNFKAGQFLVIRHGERGERIPLTIVEADTDRVRIIIQDVGYSTGILCGLEKGDVIESVIGPLGLPSEIEQYGKVVCLAGGIGAAPLKPVALALKTAGCKLTIIEGVRSEKYIIMQDELGEIADQFILMSDDGSIGKKGLVTEPLKKMISDGDIPDLVFAVGPPVMMQAAAAITREHSIPLTVSLNPVMVDGTGMCGCCRVEVGDKTKFACVDGPEFNGNEVNFELLIHRLRAYKKEEAIKTGKHHTGCGC
ncbi:MAG: sulfide/dihydroorotate dehydrogenase-like FAD/NAD-binding protein [Elusimicrobiota bacterium]